MNTYPWESVTIFWFRRDLRLEDNTGLNAALEAHNNVLPVFIFDPEILSLLPKEDQRVTLIYSRIAYLKKELQAKGSDLLVVHEKPQSFFEKINVKQVYTNEDYEPYAIKRDQAINTTLEKRSGKLHLFKDQVIFHKKEINKADQTPYTVFTPYSKKWKDQFLALPKHTPPRNNWNKLFSGALSALPTLEQMGFEKVKIAFPTINIAEDTISNYTQNRDIPSINGTSHLSVALRFGMYSIRKLANWAQQSNETFLNELIWREFFMQILWHFPNNVHGPFKSKFNHMPWEYNETHFDLWKMGKTGFPIVDAGMRELLHTGLMHNRVRMITASFLCKNLLLDYRWGEAYFAEKLLDFDLSANNGNWQWVAGTGCDAAPFFRIFSPELQQKKFDPEFKYIKKWVPEYGTDAYTSPIIDYKASRQKALFALEMTKNPMA